MYISNIEKIKSFKCGQITYSYLKNKLPLLSMDNEWYYFADTEELKKILNDAPFYIKVVNRWKL